MFATVQRERMFHEGQTLDYESPALTAELQARIFGSKSSAFQPVTNRESVRSCSDSEIFREQAAEPQGAFTSHAVEKPAKLSSSGGTNATCHLCILDCLSAE